MTVATAEGAFNAYVARPETASAPAVVVIHELFGVNADLRQTADELARQGFIAVCPDLFWRQAPGLDLDPSSPSAFETGLGLYQAFDFDAGARDVQAAVQAAGTLPGANGHVGLMGFCMGGLLTYLAAARGRVEAAVAYYGGGTDAHLAEAGNVVHPLLMHLGERDEYIPAAAQARIREAFADNPQVGIFTYPGQGHAFARHNGDHYDADSATLANRRTLEFFRRHLADPE